jgi:hypothetical protein
MTAKQLLEFAFEVICLGDKEFEELERKLKALAERNVK